jgi:hypothetical protein
MALAWPMIWSRWCGRHPALMAWGRVVSSSEPQPRRPTLARNQLQDRHEHGQGLGDQVGMAFERALSQAR